MFKTNNYKKRSQNLEKEIQQLRELIDSSAEFIKEIEKGNLDIPYKEMVSHDDNELSASLISMQSQMLKLKNEEDERNWITEGLTEFGDIIRSNSQSLKTLSKAIVSEICHRVGTSQCGIFIIENEHEESEEKYLNLIACYAYDRQKYMKDKVRIEGDFAEGLVGQVFVEGKKIHINEIPKDYCYIRSGLGKTLPAYLLILPLIYNEVSYGVLEITSLNKLPTHKIDFLEKLTINLAASIASVKINERTKVLLEESILQGERLKAQEEEMRQNFEELETTQESMRRKQMEIEQLASQYEQILEGCIDSVITINQQGTIQFFNIVAEKLWGYKRGEVLGKNVKILMQRSHADQHDQYLSNYHSTGHAKVIGIGREVEARKKDGSTVPILLTLSEAKLEDGILYTAFIKDITETKKLREQEEAAKQKLKASEEALKHKLLELEQMQKTMQLRKEEVEKLASQYEQILEGCVDSVITIGQKGTIKFFNKTAEKLWGYDRSEVIGKNVKMLMPSDYANNHDQYLKNYHNSGQAQVIGIGREVEALTKEGTKIPILLTLSEAKLENELLYTAFIKDLTEKKRLEDAEKGLKVDVAELKAIQQKLNIQTLEMEGVLKGIDSTLATIEFTPKGNIINANDNFLKATGYTLDEIKGKHHKIFMDIEESESANYRKFWRNLSLGISFVQEVKRISKTGEEIWFSASYTPIVDQDQRVIKVIKFAQNITAQKQESLDFNGQIKAIHRSHLVVEFNPRGYILSANENFLEKMKYSMEEIKGRHHKIFVNKEDQNSIQYQEFWEKLKRGTFFSGEFKRVSKDGQEVWIRGNYNPVFNQKGQVYKIVKYAQDITHEKQLTLSNQKALLKLREQEETIKTLKEMLTQQNKNSSIANENMELIHVMNQNLASIQFDLNGKIIQANDKFLHLFNYQKEELLGQHQEVLLQQEYLQSSDYQGLWTNLQKGKTQQTNIIQLKKDQQPIWVNAIFTPILNPKGKLSKVIQFANDLSFIKQN